MNIPEWAWILTNTMALLGCWGFFIVLFHIGKDNKHNEHKGE